MAFLAFLRAWWWPAYVLVYPLLAWPLQGPTRTGAVVLHWWITAVALLGGLALELGRRQDWGALWTWLRTRPAVILALVFGLWCLLAALFAPDVGAAFLGGYYDHTDGAWWAFAMVLVFVLVARRHTQDAAFAGRVMAGLTLGVCLVSVGALVEVARGAGIFYHYAAVDMPLVSFPQKGHLAGLLVMGAAAALGLKNWLRWLALLPAFALGLTVNRAGWLALALVALLLVVLALRDWRRWALALATGLALLGGWGYLNYRNSQDQVVTKQVVNEDSLYSRTFYWRAAARGILARPITGWGGGNFYKHWSEFLSFDELKGYIKAELGETLLSYTPNEPNPFHTLTPDGRKLNRFYTAWKSHDEFLEQGVMHGLVGLALYLALLVLALLNLRRAPLSAYLALVGYHLFLLLWFTIPESAGLLWTVWGLSAGEALVRRPVVLEAETAPTPTVSQVSPPALPDRYTRA